MNPAERFRRSHPTTPTYGSGYQPTPAPNPTLSTFKNIKLALQLKHLIQDKAMIEKLKSRKFLVAILTAVLVTVGDTVGLSHETTQMLVGLAASYILGQGAVDAATALKQ